MRGLAGLRMDLLDNEHLSEGGNSIEIQDLRSDIQRTEVHPREVVQAQPVIQK